jgi:hypothetical protein
MVAGSTSETEIIESHRFSFFVYRAMACHGPVLISDILSVGFTASQQTGGSAHEVSLNKEFHRRLGNLYGFRSVEWSRPGRVAGISMPRSRRAEMKGPDCRMALPPSPTRARTH